MMHQLFDLSGKVALITGAAGGLGSNFAYCLASAGARVILTARCLTRLKKLSAEIGNSLALEMDVSDKASVQKAFAQLEQANEKIDICINNAAIAKETSIFQVDEQNDFENIIQTNVMGVWFVTKATAHHMKNYGISGSIINIGSINGDALPAAGGTSYNISKAAVLHMTKSLVGELSPYSIRINAISPGFFPTNVEERTRVNENWQEALLKKIPLRFMPNLQDLNTTILYLASNKASRYVTGSVITVDGGISCGG